MTKSIFCIWTSLSLSGISVAQSATDSMLHASQNPVSIYYESLGEQSPLYNGREYVNYAGTIHVGHPYFNTTEFVKGTIHFDGMIFDDAMILYDIVKDKLIILHFNRVFRIDLPVEKISEFILPDHHFVRLYPDSARVITEGFYERLYEGKTVLYARRNKTIRIERTGNDIINVADEKDVFYILKQGVYYPVRNLSSLLNVFNSRRDAIRQQLRKNGIKYKRDPQNAVLTAVQYYDRSNN